MTGIAPSSLSLVANNIDIQGAKKQAENTQGGMFDMLLSLIKTDDSNAAKTSSSGSSTQANTSLDGIFSVLLGENSADATSSNGFSSSFTDTFGDSGPLLDWITKITQSLGLSAEQNQALQNIAIKHADDAAGSTASIAAELNAAGIVA